jgi:hypothetical protein
MVDGSAAVGPNSVIAPPVVIRPISAEVDCVNHKPPPEAVMPEGSPPFGTANDTVEAGLKGSIRRMLFATDSVTQRPPSGPSAMSLGPLPVENSAMLLPLPQVALVGMRPIWLEPF